MGGEEISPGEVQHSPDSSPSSSIEHRDLQDVESPAYRLVSPTRADFIDATPPVQIRPQVYRDRQNLQLRMPRKQNNTMLEQWDFWWTSNFPVHQKAELENERELLLEKSKNSPNSVDRWLKLLRDRDKLLRLSFCQENASILEGQIKHLENTCRSVERLARCPDPLVEQFCTTVGDIIKLCPLILAHVRNPTLHDHMERGQSPLQPSAPSPQHSWVENERRMSSEFTKGRASPSSNHEIMGSPTSTPPKYSSTQDVGQAIDAFQAGASIWSPLTPDESNGTNHIQSAENSLIGSYYALPGPNNSLQDCSTPGSFLSVSNPLNTPVTLATQTSPMLKSIESGDVLVYKPTDYNSSPYDSSGKTTSGNSSAYLESYDPTLATGKNIKSSEIQALLNPDSDKRNIYQPENKARLNTDSFKNIFNHAHVNFLTLQTSPLLEFANTKDISVFKNTDYYSPVLNIAEFKKDTKWRKVKNRRRKKKKKETTNEDLSSGDENTPGRDLPSPPKRARINSEYDDEKVTRALIASIQNLGQPSRYVLLEHLEPTLV